MNKAVRGMSGLLWTIALQHSSQTSKQIISNSKCWNEFVTFVCEARCLFIKVERGGLLCTSTCPVWGKLLDVQDTCAKLIKALGTQQGSCVFGMGDGEQP